MTGAKVFTVANQKGGVGKTSSVIQIASGLARRGDRVLMIDGDPQGNLTLFFGAKEKLDFSRLLAALAKGEAVKPEPFVNARVRKNLDLLPAANKRLKLDFHDSDIVAIYGRFAEFADSLRGRYDWIIMDSSPSNSPLERMLVRASDAVIIPLEFQLYSVSGLESILEEVRLCSTEAGREIRVHSLVFTKAENRLRRVEEYRELFATFHIPVYEICKSEYLSRSLEKSRTIWECGPSSYAARDYRTLIDKGFPVPS